MDAGVGAILDALEQHEIDDNTIVYFLSDHGGHLEAIDKGQRTGGHNGLFKGGKGMGGAEGGIRVPGIFKWKGHMPAGKTIDTPTSLLDTLPTLLELTDLPPVNSLFPELPERDLDGTSLAGLLTEGTALKPRSLIHHCRQAIHALRLVVEGRVYKMHLAKHKWSPGSTQCGWGSNNLCSCFGDGVEDLTFDPEVYDLTNDPYEDKPISSESTEYWHVVGALRQFLAEWKARVPYPPSQFKNKMDTMLSPWLQPFRIPFFGSEISEVSSDYSNENIGITSSEGAYVFEELEEEEFQGLMVVGPYMHEPDDADVEVVPNQPDMEWRRDPKRLNEW
ncbi:putative arylsulfatase D [Penaeus vannamei]|uniref:Putative arylsulfatase D n=1 Tax=Penaeus vannamei TaxID=6689 RepID=A0A423SL65_PENVA|nr:putative arylsulfatase D [Penaeus vannamei]